jgi:hypothetical protein
MSWLNTQTLPHADSSGRFTCLGHGVDRVYSKDGHYRHFGFVGEMKIQIEFIN